MKHTCDETTMKKDKNLCSSAYLLVYWTVCSGLKAICSPSKHIIPARTLYCPLPLPLLNWGLQNQQQFLYLFDATSLSLLTIIEVHALAIQIIFMSRLLFWMPKVIHYPNGILLHSADQQRSSFIKLNLGWWFQSYYTGSHHVYCFLF
jgi:hypothetical protein